MRQTEFQAQQEQQNGATLTPESDTKSGSPPPSLFLSGSCKTADVSKHTMLAQTQVLLGSSRKKKEKKKTKNKNPDIHMDRVRKCCTPHQSARKPNSRQCAAELEHTGPCK